MTDIVWLSFKISSISLAFFINDYDKSTCHFMSQQNICVCVFGWTVDHMDTMCKPNDHPCDAGGSKVVDSHPTEYRVSKWNVL